MIHPDKIEKIIELSETVLQFREEEIDYQKISDDFLELVEAKYAAFNLFDEAGEFFTTTAISGNSGLIKKASAMIGVSLKGKTWPPDLAKAEKTKEKIVTRFKSLQDIAEGVLPAQMIAVMENGFNLGEVIIVKIVKNGVNLGDFTLIMEKGVAFENEKVAELYTRQLGILIVKKRDEDKLANAKRKIEESEANFQTFFQTVDDVILVVNQQGQIVFANRATEIKVGYTREELENMPVLDLNPLEHREEAEIIFGEMLAGKRDECPLPLKRKDGTHMPVETRIWFGKWNGDDCIFAISKDLTVQQAALERFEKIFDANPSLMGLTSIENGRFVQVNKSFLRNLGYSKNEVIGKTTLELGLFIDPKGQEDTARFLETEGEVNNIELAVRKKDGEIIAGLFSGEIIENQGAGLFLTVMNDITKQKQMEEALKISAVKYSGIFHESPIAIEMYDAEGSLIEVNNACLKMFGIKNKEEIIRFKLFDDPNLDEDRKTTLVHQKQIRFVIEFDFEKVKQFNLYQTTCNGLKYLDISIKEMTVDSKKTGYIVQINDISDQKRAEKEMEYLSFYDHLTGVYNRRYYEVELMRLDSERNMPVTILMGDVNGLKKINDYYGHLAGDELLKKISAAIKKACREDDIIARIGGDEFVAILPKTTEVQAEKIIDRINEMVSTEKVNSQNISIAFGCKSKANMEEDIKEIFIKAENNMYKRKQLMEHE